MNQTIDVYETITKIHNISLRAEELALSIMKILEDMECIEQLMEVGENG